MRTALRFALLLVVVVLLVAPGSAWLSGYTYRQMHNITGCATWSANQTNYQVVFTVNNTTGASYNNTAFTNGHSQPTWSDLRFTSLADVEYDYWVEEGTTTATSATVIVEVPTIANSTSINTSLYMYYGNPTGSSGSNGQNTFVFFDSFTNPAAAVNTTLWTTTAAPTVASGVLTVAGAGTRVHSNRTNSGSTASWTATSQKYVWESLSNYNSATQRQWFGMENVGITSEMDFDNDLFAGQLTARTGTTYTAATSGVGAWKNYQILVNGTTSVIFSINDAIAATHTSGIQTGALNVSHATWEAGAILTTEWSLVRSYIYPEPVNLWWGDEEAAYVFIAWDKDSYASGEDAIIETIFPNEYWDTINYTYYTAIYRYPDLATPVDTYFIYQQTYNKTLETEDYGIGTYYAMLYLTDIGTGTTYFVDYDYATVVNGVTISGIVFNATAGTSLTGATVDITQAGTTNSYTSTVAGYLTTSPLNIGQAITVNGSLAGYTPYTSTFTPPGAANITKAIPLVSTTTACYWTAAANSTSITGLVDELPYYIPASGAYINLSNSTWYSNQTLGPTGWYIFEDLNNTEPYSLIAGKTGFDDYSTTVTTGTDDLTWYNFTLGADFTLTVYVKDAASGAYLTDNVTVVIEDTVGGTSTDTTTTGVATFPSISGGYTVTASCIGYTQGTTFVNVDSNENVTLSLTSSSTGGTPYYTAHEVEIVVQDNYGNGIPDTTVEITPTDTTLDDWDWMNWLLGVPTSVDIENTPMSGETDSNGALTFVMVKEIKYKVDIVNAAEAINETYYLFPKDDMYVFVVGTSSDFESPTSLTGTITWNLTNTTINATHGNLTFQYYDSSGQTTNLSFWVKSHTSPVTTCYQTYCSNPNSCNVGYVCGADNGQDYYWGFDAVTTNRGNITASQSITYQKLVNLGIMSGYYPWIAAAFLIVIAAVFSVISVKFGAVLIPVFAFLFFYMKWINLTWQQTTLFTVLLVIGVFAYIRKQEDKVGN